MVLAYVALGANVGDARTTVLWAMDRLAELEDTTLRQRSGLYRSEPVDAAGPDFINAVVALETGLCAPLLLAQLHALELRAGRVRPYRNAPRTLDLDLLLYGDASIDSPQLQVPHPRMAARAFVLLPLAELAPGRVTAVQMAAVQSQRLIRL